MTELLALGDLKGMTEDQVKDHIASEYRKESGDYPYAEEVAQLRDELRGVRVLLAYESVGSWGCDSQSFFLIERDGKLYENHGGHCSCYGFEGQWEPEETEIEALLRRNFSYDMGGYDYDSENNTRAMKDYVLAMSNAASA